MKTVSVLTAAFSIASAQKVVQFDIRGTHPADVFRASLSKRDGTVLADLTNQEYLYRINVSIGTPAQQFELQLDTGSSDLWVLTDEVQPCQKKGACTGGVFNPNASSTWSDTNPGVFDISYVDGTGSTGDYGTDTIVVGGTTITNQTIGIATKSTLERGLMGVGFSDNEASCVRPSNESKLCYPSVVDQMVTQGKINTRAYSLWLNDLNASTGSILFGGVDSSRYKGELIAVPVIPDLNSIDGSLQDFSVAWTNLTITTPDGVQSYWDSSYDSAATLDSGTSFAHFPNNLADSLFVQFGAYVVDKQSGTAVAPCYLRTSNATIDFAFGGQGGPIIHVPVREFLIDTGSIVDEILKDLGGTEYCALGFSYANGGPILLGDTILRSAYVVYDLEQKQIALANTNFDGGAANIMEITNSSGSAIPGVSSTATAITTAVQGVSYPAGAATTAYSEAAATSAAATGTTTIPISSGSKPPLASFTTAKYTGQGGFDNSGTLYGPAASFTGFEGAFITVFIGLSAVFGSGMLLL